MDAALCFLSGGVRRNSETETTVILFQLDGRCDTLPNGTQMSNTWQSDTQQSDTQQSDIQQSDTQQSDT
jgi:hypothetical protein